MAKPETTQMPNSLEASRSRAQESTQTVTRQVDIPDHDFRKPDPIKLPSNVVTERTLRRYIRRDGMFRRNVEQFFARVSGYDNQQLPVMELLKTAEEAAEVVKEMCEATGRTVEKDFLTGRWKAVPGWDLGILVPGMKSSEQYAPQKAAGEARQRISDALVAKQEDKINELSDVVGELKALLMDRDKNKAGDQGQESKPFEKMNHEELNAVADTIREAGVRVDFSDCITKADKIKDLQKANREHGTPE